MADLKIQETDVLEPVELNVSEDEERITLGAPIGGRTYTVQFPMSRKDDVAYGLRQVADRLNEIGS